MSPTKTQQLNTHYSLTSVALLDAYTDFVLSRQAMNCSPETMRFYRFTLGPFMSWIEQNGVTDPQQVTARYVRQFLAELVDRGLQDTTQHTYARAIRTLLKFWHAEGYIPQPVKFAMPKLFKKRLPVLTADELRAVIAACDNVRDKALITFLADTGLRRAELLRLNWSDIDMSSGRVQVKMGKGKKDRIAVAGASTRRVLLAYRRSLAAERHDGALFQTNTGGRFTKDGLLAVFRKLTKRTGLTVTPHCLRRTFTILSLRAGMSPLHLQALAGWEDMAMLKHYAQMTDDDLLQAHREHSPVDNL